MRRSKRAKHGSIAVGAVLAWRLASELQEAHKANPRAPRAPVAVVVREPRAQLAKRIAAEQFTQSRRRIASIGFWLWLVSACIGLSGTVIALLNPVATWAWPVAVIGVVIAILAWTFAGRSSRGSA